MSFEQAMRASGLLPRAVVADGLWRRVYEQLIAKRRYGSAP